MNRPPVNYSQQGGYAPQQGEYPSGSYQQGYLPTTQQQAYGSQGGYPPTTQQQGYAPQTGYPPSTQQQGGYSAGQQQQGYTPHAQGFAPPQSYPPSTSIPEQQVTEKTPWNPSQAALYNGSDIGTEDVDENQQGVETLASAPSYDLVISGYENSTASSDVPVGPPPPYEPPSYSEVAQVDTSKLPAITDEQARDALLGLVAQNTCWGKGAAKKMDVKDIIPTNAYHYTLESFTEGRSTRCAHEPYRGGVVDGPQFGIPPGPWDIPCTASTLFKNEVHKIPVPHTDAVKVCHRCFGRGFNRCWKCHGRGNVRCSFCHGSGHRHVTNANGHSRRQNCIHCHGRGRKRCTLCHGSGCVLCSDCAGYGNIKQFIQLTVAFTNRLSDHIVERTDLPDELIRNVQGDVIFEQVLIRVSPIQRFFVEEINLKSSEIVNFHANSWPAERILQQRHVLRSVPVHECYFKYENQEGRFWVYGKQHTVYTKDYPHTCCCCNCVIL